MFGFLTVWIRTLLKRDRLLFVPSLVFYFILVHVDPHLLEGATPDHMPSLVTVLTLIGIVLGNVLVVLVTTMMGISVHQSGLSGLSGGVLKLSLSYVKLVCIFCVLFLPIAGISVALSLLHAWAVWVFLGLLVLVGVLTVPLFPLLVLRDDLRWYRVPFVALRIARDRLVLMMMVTSFVYFVKLAGVLLGILFSGIPVLGASFFVPILSGVSDCVSILALVVFYQEFIAPGVVVSKIV